jgi:TP901 family phage tail tape measure protein
MSSAAIRGGRVAIEIGADVKRFYAALNAVQSRLRGLGATFGGLGARMGVAGGALTAPFVAIAAQTANFQDTMAAVGAVTNATGADFERLKERALALGASTSFTAQQVAEGMQALGQGGFSVEETLGGIEGVLLLARAGMLDLGAASSIAVAVLRSFKMPTQDAGKVADILAMAANSSNASVQGLGEALSTVGGIAFTAGTSLTELTAAIGLLADRGMAGSEAGTALRRVLIGLSQEQDALRGMGVEVTDPKTGKLKPLKEILQQLKAQMAGMADTDKIAKLSKIFDVFGANAVLQLMNAGDELGALDEKLQGSEGSAAEAAKKMDDTLGGSWRMFTSAIEGVALAMGEAIAGPLRAYLDYLSSLASGVNRAVKQNADFIVALATIGPAAMAAGAAFVAIGGSLQVAAFSVGGFSKALQVVASPISMVLGLSRSIVTSFASVTGGLGVMASAWLRAGASMLAFVATTTATAAGYMGAVAGMVASTVSSMIAIGAAWIGAAVASAGAWIAHIKALVTYYTGALAGITAITISRTSAMAGAWIAQAGSAVASFVGASITGLASYLGTLAVATTSTVASAASMAAAWLAPVAPILALGGAIAGIGIALTGALSQGGSVASAIGSIFEPLGPGLQRVVEDGKKVFGDLYNTATVTFAGISDAITAGDMSLAFEVLWAGLKAAWLRGQQAVMSYVDQFVEYLQNRWGDAVTFIAKAMTSGLAGIERAWITVSGVIFSAFQTAINKVMDVWDIAVGAIQKAIAYIRSFFDKSIDYKAIKNQIDSANKERKAARDKDAADSQKDRDERVQNSRRDEAATNAEIDRQNEEDRGARAGRTAGNAVRREAEVQQANSDLGNASARAEAAKESVDLLKAIGEADSNDELRALWERAKELFDAGLISAERLAEIENKMDDQVAENDKTRAMTAQEEERAARDKASADAASSGVEQQRQKVETAGTFSAIAAMYMGGAGLAERTARAAEETARNTRKFNRGQVQP